MSSAGLEPTFLTSERPQSHDSDCADIGIGYTTHDRRYNRELAVVIKKFPRTLVRRAKLLFSL